MVALAAAVEIASRIEQPVPPAPKNSSALVVTVTVPAWAMPGSARAAHSAVAAKTPLLRHLPIWLRRSLERFAQLGGRPLGREDVELDARRHLEAGSNADSRRDVEVPVELVGTARSSQRPGVELRDLAEAAVHGPQRGAEHPDTDLTVALEARRRLPGNDPQLERRARRPRADQQRVVVDRHQSLLAANLLGCDLGQQVAAHRVLVVGNEALPLARDLGRDEAERVELGVAVLEGSAGLLALVEDQLHIGGLLGVRSHPLAPAGHRGRQLRVVELGESRDMTWRVDDDLVESGGHCRLEQVRLPASRRRAQRIPGRGHSLIGLAAAGLIALRQRRVEVGDGSNPPAWRVSIAAARAVRPDLRRRPVLAALAERALLGRLRALLGGKAAEVEGPVSPGGREDRPQP